jgi:hypothetical protein
MLEKLDKLRTKTLDMAINYVENLTKNPEAVPDPKIMSEIRLLVNDWGGTEKKIGMGPTHEVAGKAAKAPFSLTG